jgi:hypothetical protein
MMSGEPEPPTGRDKLSGALVGITFVWLGLVLGLLILSGVLTLVIIMNGPIVDEPELGYAALLFVPVGIIGAFVVAPMMAPTSPEKAAWSMKDSTGSSTWAGTPPDDPYYWFPVYASGFFVRAGMLEGSSVIMLICFVLTANWALLGGVAVLAGLLIAQRPVRTKYDAWLEDVRQRQTGM